MLKIGMVLKEMGVMLPGYRQGDETSKLSKPLGVGWWFINNNGVSWYTKAESYFDARKNFGVLTCNPKRVEDISVIKALDSGCGLTQLEIKG